MIKTGKELAAAAEAVARKHKTLYVMGCFGAPLYQANQSRYTKNDPYNQQPARSAKIKDADGDTFGFDCCGLIKGLMWGWRGEQWHHYGGATYSANGVPDHNANTMLSRCDGISTNFSKIEPGEVVWTEGHIGIYIGDGLAVEATPKWKDGVQVTAVLNKGIKLGYSGRRWKKHGKLPFLSYTTGKTTDELAREVIAGMWGNGAERRKRLTAAGYDPDKVQKQVNALLK